MNAFLNAWRTCLPTSNGAQQQRLSQQTEYFTVIGKAIGFLFGKDLLAVYTYDVHSTGTGNQINFCLRPKSTDNFSCLTGSSWLIVSGSTILNGYLHHLSFRI